MNMREVGQIVAHERKKQGVTQLELSQVADVGRRFVVDLEAGKPTLQAGKLLKVLSVLGVEVKLMIPEGK